jgi:predicted nuclease of predicted toxin-antitoxin system
MELLFRTDEPPVVIFLRCVELSSTRLQVLHIAGVEKHLLHMPLTAAS